MDRSNASVSEQSMPQGIDVLAVNAPALEQAATEVDITAVIKSRFWMLRFPAKLEKQYQTYYTPRAIKNLHARVPIMVVLNTIMISGIVPILPKSSYGLWLDIEIFIFIALFGGWALSYIPRFHRWYQGYVTAGSIIVIAGSIVVANVIPLASSTILAYAGIMYAVLIVYSYVGLLFTWALAAGWLSGLIGVVLTHALGAEMNWSLMHRTYTCTSLLGMGLAYALDRQERNNFLQTCLLQLAVIKGEKLAKQLDDLSRQDGLTGLANRRHLDEMMVHEWNRELRRKQPLTLMIIDVDYFKSYNDMLGHMAGDNCLRQIAQLFLETTKRSGELAARYGGEEFVLLFPMMDAATSEQHAIRLLERMAELALPHPNGGYVTFSIGIAVCVPVRESRVDQVLRQADAALYRAKANGRNRYEFFNEEMRGLKHTTES